MNKMKVMIVGLLALAAFIQLVRAEDQAGKTPVDDDDSDHENDVDSDDEEEEIIRPYAGQEFGVLDQDERFKKYKPNPAEEKDEYYVEEDTMKTFAVPDKQFGELVWRTNESPDKILKDMHDERLKLMPTMEAAYAHFRPPGKHTIGLNVYEDWNKDPGKHGLEDLEKIEKGECAKMKTNQTCRPCCGNTAGSGMKEIRSMFTKKVVCVCRSADLSP